MNPRMTGSTPQDELFRNRLDNMVAQRYGLLRLTKLIDWSLLIIQTQVARLVAVFFAQNGGECTGVIIAVSNVGRPWGRCLIFKCD